MPSERILVVEDNPMNAKLVRDVLVAKGYEVLEATTAEDGLVLAAEQGPDLVLMDIRLPGTDGTTALRELKRAPATSNIPVIAVTASVMPSEQDKLIAAGFDGFQPKPINLKALLNDIRSFLDKAAG